MSSPELPVWAWLACYVLAVVCAVSSLCLSFSPRGRSGSWIAVRTGLAFLVMLGVAYADLVAEDLVGDGEKVWLRFGLFTAGTAAVVALFRHQAWIGRRTWWRTWGRPATFLSISLIATVFIGVQFHRLANPVSNDATLSRLASAVRPTQIEQEMYGVTDLGRTIPLLQFEPTDGHFEASELIPEPFRARVIVADSAHSTANCHGWIFTGGQYLVQSRHVDSILEDNGYRIVSEAGVGDVIVYRDDAGVPIHTGIVKAVGREGFVLIESKWGALDTYYHLPDDQVYSMNYAFYRSSRDGHAIHLLMRSPSQPPLVGERGPEPEQPPALPSRPAVNG